MTARIVFWLMLALVVFAPLPFGSNRPWAWSMLALCSAALLGLWAIADLVNPRPTAIAWHRYRPVAVLFGGFVLWLLFQASPLSPVAWHHPSWAMAEQALGQKLVGAISVSPTDSLGGVMRLLCYAAVFWLAMQLGRRTERARVAWWTLSLAITGYAIYGLFEQFSAEHMILWFPKWAYQDSLTSTFINRNHFAVYAGLGTLLTLALITDETKNTARHGLHSRSGVIYFLDHMRPPIFILMIAFVILATALLLSHSRAGLLCTGIGIFVMLTAFGMNEVLRSRALFAFGGIIITVGLAVLFVSGDVTSARMGELIENAGPRGQVYRLVLSAIADRPLLGTGLGTFDRVFRLERSEDFGPNEPSYDVAHNSYLEMMLEAGIPAAAIFYAALFMILLVFVHGARNRRRATIYPCSGLASAALLGTHALVDFSLQIPAIALTFAAIAGIAYAQSWRHDERGDPSHESQIRE